MVEKTKNFWLTLPGILSGVAAIIGAAASLYIAIIQNSEDNTNHNIQSPPKNELKTKMIGIWFHEHQKPFEGFTWKRKATTEYFENDSGTEIGYITLIHETGGEFEYYYILTFEWILNGPFVIVKTKDLQSGLKHILINGEKRDLKGIDGKEAELIKQFDTYFQKRFLKGLSGKSEIREISDNSMVVKIKNESGDDKLFVQYKRAKHLVFPKF